MNSKWTDRKQNDLSAERAGVSRSSAASFFQPTICRKTVIFTLVSWAFCFRRRYWQSHFYAGSFQARDNLLRFRTLRIAWIICSSSELDGLLCKLADAGLSLSGVGHKDNDQIPMNYRDFSSDENFLFNEDTIVIFNWMQWSEDIQWGTVGKFCKLHCSGPQMILAHKRSQDLEWCQEMIPQKKTGIVWIPWNVVGYTRKLQDLVCIS